MLLWDQALLAQVEAVAEASRAGRPTTLVIEGGPGYGKTALLDELVRRTPGFAIRRADCAEADRPPLGVLAQWGIEVPRPDDLSEPVGLVVAQALREQADALTLAGPVLLIIDDLQWADPESLTALGWLLRRAAGDRLLVAAATRPGGPGWTAGRPGRGGRPAVGAHRRQPALPAGPAGRERPSGPGRGPGPACPGGVRPEPRAPGGGAQRPGGDSLTRPWPT